MKRNNGGFLSLIIKIVVAIFVIRIAVAIACRLAGLIDVFALIIAIAFIALVIAIIISAFVKGDRGENKAPVDVKVKGTSANQEYFNMSADDSAKLKQAKQHILSARGLASRINNLDVRRAAEEALLSADKLVKTMKEQPSEIKNCRQFVNYYLPTLVVVLQKYKTVEDGGVAKEDTVGKLTDYLADIKTALEKLYESLFANEKFDIDVETEAMRMALKRDGLISEKEIEEASTALVVIEPEEVK